MVTGAPGGVGGGAPGAAAETFFRRFPRARGDLPWLGLGRFPTRVCAAPRLGADLGLDLWVKRDDESGAGYGGNKVRKLELCLAEALARGARRVLTMGGLGSNQVVAAAFYARQLGLACDALLFDQPETPILRANLRADLCLGARLHVLRSWRDAPTVVAGVLGAVGRDLYPLGPGSSSPLGTVGYVAAALELEEQVARGECPEPSVIFVPLGSGGTAAGLLLGLAQTRLRTRLAAVRVVHPALAGAPGTGLLAWRTARLLASCGAQLRPFAASRLEVLGGFLGAGYGAPTPAGVAAVARAADREGLCLETTYTGKTLAALIARSPGLRGPVLLWDTFSSADLAALGRGGEGRAVPARLRALVEPW
ncbi:MAG: pyridoxal-phosphate dependent enzyme [Deltaproteobacteria bacterium]|nr:pyridoxal-phosphate dependent enzyme [Deltaproteobacteria bacterium]